MIKNIFFKGDTVLWCIIALLVIFSFLPVFSASSNLAFVVGKGTPYGYLLKHFIIMTFGFSLIYFFHKVPFIYFKGISVLMLPVVFILLIYTASQGNIINGTNANRWIQIPIIGFSFQTSSLASMVLMMYVAHYISKNHDKIITLGNSFLSLWIPILVVLLLIFPSNFSTAIILFSMVIMLLFLGGYPFKYLEIFLSILQIQHLIVPLLDKHY